MTNTDDENGFEANETSATIRTHGPDGMKRCLVHWDPFQAHSSRAINKLRLRHFWRLQPGQLGVA